MAAEAFAASAIPVSRALKASARRIPANPTAPERSVEMMDAEVNAGPALWVNSALQGFAKTPRVNPLATGRIAAMTAVAMSAASARKTRNTA